MRYIIDVIIEYIKKNIGLYIILLLILVIGILSGSLTVNLLSSLQKEELTKYLSMFFVNINNMDLDSTNIFYSSLSNNLKILLIIFLSGLLIFGFPIVFIIIFLRGFMLGFTTGYFISEFGTKGVLLSIFAIVPQNILIITGILSIGVTTLYFDFSVLKSKRKYYRESYGNLIVGYIFSFLFFSLFLLFASLIEGYISPFLIRIIANYIL
ncbi:stage II sporulation protein M [Thermovenabulum gondwanense]|uniref:Stage II sporulation protein M n=1 Tax=Thermovenabulum gondwanense TaxID=520767 RepID=A0A162MGM3_9FIRM|nr:stage II sporulation protein M [Thermovenabulum gondwanense]KYO65799.1 Stage II sporulation protein M [Thermovenabulum gondwanense]